VADVVFALLGFDAVEQPADGLPEGLDGSFSGVAQHAFELGERQFFSMIVSVNVVEFAV
jgi:hypothetical protein